MPDVTRAIEYIDQCILNYGELVDCHGDSVIGAIYKSDILKMKSLKAMLEYKPEPYHFTEPVDEQLSVWRDLAATNGAK